MRTPLLDNEAVQALVNSHHAKQRAVVPTTVRVEAGWDRSAPGVAAINRFGWPTPLSTRRRPTSEPGS